MSDFPPEKIVAGHEAERRTKEFLRGLESTVGVIDLNAEDHFSKTDLLWRRRDGLESVFFDVKGQLDGNERAITMNDKSLKFHMSLQHPVWYFGWIWGEPKVAEANEYALHWAEMLPSGEGRLLYGLRMDHFSEVFG